MQLEINITQEDIDKANFNGVCQNCIVATAIKRQLSLTDDDVSVGFNSCTIKNQDYYIDKNSEQKIHDFTEFRPVQPFVCILTRWE